MGVAGRDYMKDESGSRGRWSPGRVTWTLIAVNGLLWILFSASFNAGSNGPWRSLVPRDGLAGFIYDHLVLHTDEVFASGRIWQLFTAFWIHDWLSVSHVFWNMLLLFFFGRSVESDLGARGFLKLYIGGGLVASVILTGYTYVTGVPAAGFGASGAVYAVMVWLACMHPRRTILLFFILPLQLWVAVGVFMVGKEVLDLTQHVGNAGSAVAHLAGAAWGLAYFRFFPRWGSTHGPGGWIVKFRRKRARAIEAHKQQDEAAVKARVDALLTKISTEGMGALTEEEKSFLQEASKRFR